MHETMDEYTLPWWKVSNDLRSIIWSIKHRNYGNAEQQAEKLKGQVDIMEKQLKEAPDA